MAHIPKFITVAVGADCTPSKTGTKSCALIPSLYEREKKKGGGVRSPASEGLAKIRARSPVLNYGVTTGAAAGRGEITRL